jgi:hypothetical protein
MGGRDTKIRVASDSARGWRRGSLQWQRGEPASGWDEVQRATSRWPRALAHAQRYLAGWASGQYSARGHTIAVGRPC